MEKSRCECAVVICAAGSSSRMNSGGAAFGNTATVKKEYRRLNDFEGSPTVLGAAVAVFRSVPSVDVIVIAIQPGTEETARAALPQGFLESSKPLILFVNGGKTRRASVLNALSSLAKHDPRYVLIHDGARPWVSKTLIEDVIAVVKKHGAVVPLLPLSETPKECNASILDEDGKFNADTPVLIKNHLKRSNTGAAQTPQAFEFSKILYAHEKAAEAETEEFTDDAEIWGRFCGDVAAIPGSPENRKITFPQDIGGF